MARQFLGIPPDVMRSFQPIKRAEVDVKCDKCQIPMKPTPVGWGCPNCGTAKLR